MLGGVLKLMLSSFRNVVEVAVSVSWATRYPWKSFAIFHEQKIPLCSGEEQSQVSRCQQEVLRFNTPMLSVCGIVVVGDDRRCLCL